MPALALVVVVATLLAGAPAAAYERRTTYEFDGIALQGEPHRPEGSFIVARPTHADVDAGRAQAIAAAINVGGAVDDADRVLLARWHMDRARNAMLRAYVAENERRDASAERTEAKRAQQAAQALFLDVVCAPAERVRLATCALRTPAPADDVLFDAAWSFADSDADSDADGDADSDADSAHAMYAKLLAAHPSSPFAAYAHVALGDAAFEHGAWRAAADHYDAVAAPDALAMYATYKRAWIELNLASFAQALALFERVVVATRGSEAQKALHHEATHDFVLAFASTEKPASAAAFATFSRVDKERALSMLAQLGAVLLERGDADAAAAVYADALARAPRDAKACDWRNAVVDAAVMSGSRRRVIDAVTALVVAQCDDGARTRQLAQRWHVEATKTRDDGAYDDADAMYALFLAHYPDRKDAGAMRMYRAELAYAHGRYEQAAQLYEAAAASPRLDASIVHAALYAGVIARRNAFHARHDDDTRKELVAAIERFLAREKNSTHVDEVRALLSETQSPPP